MPEITMDEKLRKKAEIPIRRMLKISEKFKHK
jgi:quinolinate synthase